jgi:deoxyribonuclease V
MNHDNRKRLNPFSWPVNINDAKSVQAVLRDKVKIIPLKKRPRFIAGVDAAFTRDRVIGVACLYMYPELVLLAEAFAIMKCPFPYIPGFLSFREGPAIVEAINKFKDKPDITIFDGQGIAHPKGLGIASHVGVLLNIPTIGCAKSRLTGEYREPGPRKGTSSPLRFNGRTVGAILRTRDNVKPVFVSPGHLVDLKSSIGIVLGCISRFRIPEPLRRADFLSKQMGREISADSPLREVDKKGC